MDGLPLETLMQISSYLDLANLRCFARVSKRCKTAIDSHRFHSLTLEPVGGRKSVARCMQDLSTLRPWRHVRRLKLWENTLPRNCRPQDVEAVIQLMRALPVVRDVIWRSKAQISLNLVRHLHTIQPRCRLHISMFRLDSLNVSGATKLDNQDLEIATSPCLHSVGYDEVQNFDNEYYDELANPDWAKERRLAHALFEMIAGGAENLRQVAFCPMIEGLTLQSTSWLGLDRAERPGRLEALEMTFENALDFLHHCIKTDFSQLRKLELSLNADLDSLSFARVEWLESVDMFSSLTDLTISACTWSGDSALVALCCTVSHLKKLRLVGEYSIETVRTIVMHCNPLEHFHTESFVQRRTLDVLLNWPDLEELSIGWRRDATTRREASFLRKLGCLMKVSRLKLRIASANSVSTSRIVSRMFGAKHHRDNQMHPPAAAVLDEVHACMRDLAFDSALARSMFRAISRSKPQDAVPLESLELNIRPWIEEMVSFCEQHIPGSECFMMHLSHSWLCLRSSLVDMPHKCTLRRDERPRMEESCRRLAEGTFAGILHKLWPRSIDVGVENAWHSFPIYEENETLELALQLT